ncbi:MAG: hypothetical protein WDO71_12040 [Bacteroidota bacterium]
MPDYNQPSDHPNSIQFTGIQYTDSIHQKWGILLSFRAKEKLKAALLKGTIKLKVIFFPFTISIVCYGDGPGKK